jgi:NTE family protein
MFRGTSHLPIVLAAALLLGACAAQRTGSLPSGEPPEVMGPPIPETHVEEQDVPPESYGPQPPASTETSTDTSTAAASPTATATVTDASTAVSTATATAAAPEPARLCVVLGPGMAKAMAEAAVLDVLRKAKLPVYCVVGTEMGGIVGALYSYGNGNTNGLQWQLFKLNKDNYFNYPMLSLREPRSSGHRLHEFLRGVFHGTAIERLPIKFATVAVDDEGDNTVELDHGDLAAALSASVAVSGVFESWKVNGIGFRSAVSTDPAPVELARKLGGNFVVLVDVLLNGGAPAKSRYHRAFTAARSVTRLQKKEAQFVIQVNTGTIAFDDFGHRAEILAAGTAAAEKALPELKAAWEKWSAGQH